MPKTVEFPELGTIDFPDEMSWDEVQTTVEAHQDSIKRTLFDARSAQRAAETVQADPPTISDRYVQTIRSVGKGAISAGTGLAKAVGEVAAAINRKVYDGGKPGTVYSGNPEDLTTYKVGKAIEQNAEQTSPDLPGLEDSFLFRDVPSGVGQVGGALVTGGAVKGAVAKGTAGILGTEAAGKLAVQAGVRAGLTQMAGAEFDDAYQRSIDRGDSPDMATAKATGYAVISTAIESKLGLGRLAKRFGMQQPATKAVEQLAKEGVGKVALKEAVSGFTEEALQRAAQDYIVDGELDLNAIAREGGAGAVVQALLGALAHGSRRARAKETLGWISEKQRDGITTEEMQATGVNQETLDALGITIRIDKPPQEGDFQYTEPAEQSTPAPPVEPAESTAVPPTEVQSQEADAGPQIARVLNHANDIFDGAVPESVQFYHQPGETAGDGSLVVGSNQDGQIRINTAHVTSRQELEGTLIEEAFHNIESHPEFTQLVQQLTQSVSEAERSKMEELGYSKERAPMEAVARMLGQENLTGSARTRWQSFWAGFRDMLQKYFGWAGVKFNDSTARKLISESLRSLQPAPQTEPSGDSGQLIDAQSPSAPVSPADQAIRYSLKEAESPNAPERQHVQQLDASADLDPTIKELIRNRTYERRSNKDDAATAAEMVNAVGLEQAKQAFSQVNMPEGLRTMLGNAILKEAGRQERQARIDGQIDTAQRLARETAEFIDSVILPRSTEIAQALQAFSVFSFLTPSGWISTAKRVIDRVGERRTEAIYKPTVETANALRQVNAEVVAGLPGDAKVQQDTARALKLMVETDTEVQAAIREEVSAEFGNLRELLRDHFKGLNPGKTLAEKLSLVLGLKPEEAGRKARQIEKQWQGRFQQKRATIQQRASEQRTLWQRYQASIARSVASLVEQSLRGPDRPKAALEGFSERIAGILRKHVEDRFPKSVGTPTKLAPMTPAQIIGEAVRNPEKYQQAWAATIEELQTQFQDRPAVLQRLEAALAQRPDAIASGPVDKAVATKVKDLQIKLGDIVRKHYTETAAVGRVLADRLVQDAGISGESAFQFASAIQKRFGELATIRKQKELKNLVKAGQGARVANRKPLAQKLIEFSNLGGFSDQAAVDAVRERLAIPQLSAEATRELVAKIEKLQELPEGSVQRIRATVDAMNFISRQKGFRWYELPMAFWYANTLSGPITHLINISSTFLSLGGNIATVLSRHPMAIGMVTDAVYDGFKRGGVEASEILKSGINTRTSKLDANSALELLQDSDLKGAGVVLNKWRYITRALGAADQLFYAPAREVKSRILARGLAMKDGLRGSALQVRVREILALDTERRAQAEAQATAEGLKGTDLARRVYQLLDEQRPQDLNEAADQFALETTFNNKPYGILGGIAKAVNLANRETFVTRFVMPFVNIVANVTNESLNYFAPVGVSRAAWAHGNLWWTGTAKLHGVEIRGTDAIYDAYAKAALGTLGIAAIVAMAAKSVDDDEHWFGLTASGPRDPNARKALKSGTGYIPYSVRIGKRYFNYANTPLAVPLAIAGEYLDALKYGKLSQADALNRVAYAVPASLKVISQQSFLDSLSGLANWVERPSETKTADRIVENLSRNITTVVVPNALRQIDRLFDPRVMQPTTMEARVIAQIPFARRALKPGLNVLGEAITIDPLNRLTSVRKGDELWSLLASKQAWPPAPEQGLLTDDEQYDLIEHRGPLLRARLESMMARIAAAKPHEARKLVDEAASESTRRSKAALGLDRLERLRKLEQP